MRPSVARPSAGPARGVGRRSSPRAQAPSSRLEGGAPRDHQARAGGAREVLGIFAATLLLVGAPALLMLDDLRDPACAQQVEESKSPFRALAVDDHRISRCLLGSEDAEALPLLAGNEARQGGRALPDPTW